MAHSRVRHLLCWACSQLAAACLFVGVAVAPVRGQNPQDPPAEVVLDRTDPLVAQALDFIEKASEAPNATAQERARFKFARYMILAKLKLGQVVRGCTSKKGAAAETRPNRLNAYTNYPGNKIILDKVMTTVPTQTAYTLVHELVHCGQEFTVPLNPKGEAGLEVAPYCESADLCRILYELWYNPADPNEKWQLWFGARAGLRHNEAKKEEMTDAAK